MTLRGYLGLGMILALAALSIALAVQTGQAHKYRKLDDAHRACVTSIGPKHRPDDDPTKLCAPEIAAAWAIASRATACDGALAAKPENTSGVRASCSAAVKHLGGLRDGALNDLAGVRAELKEERDGRDAALRRAEAAGKAQAERTARAQAARATAPRDPDGLSVFGADGLSKRWGDPTKP
jgi:hypothetical protein